MNLIDLHCDTVWRLMENGTKASLLKNSFSIDVAGLKKAGSMAQFFACFVYMQQFQGEDRYTQGYEYAKKMLARLKQEVKRENALEFAGNAEDILRNMQQNKISVIPTIEEGGILEGKMERLEELYREGIRLVTILWNEENCIGYPNSREQDVMQKGLKPFGFEVVERMNELGILIDVSHLSDGGFYDVLKTSKAPVLASHSNARSVCAHPRNLTDEMIRMLGETGGVVGLNFYPYFLNDSGKAGVEDMIRHVRHITNAGGVEVAAIGTDFDGFDEGELEIQNIGEMEKLYTGLKKAGFKESELEAIWHKNAWRLIKQVF